MKPKHIAPVILIGLLSPTPAWSHGDSHEQERKKSHWGTAHTGETPFGRAGDPKNASRTIALDMSDAMRFTPDRIEVKQGETVRLVHHNAGKIMHEFVLGTKTELDEHAALMTKFPNMEHDEPYMAHVGPGKTGEIVWTFNRPGEFDFACLIPGHYQAGMVGKVKVVAEGKSDARNTHKH